MKYSRLLMIMSAFWMGAIGVFLAFFPHEVLIAVKASADNEMALFVQITGALYLGFALMNWMAKSVLIGGIYARPLAIGNLVHFMVGAIALMKFSLPLHLFNLFWLPTFVYVIFAVLFGLVLLNNPTTSKVNSDA